MLARDLACFVGRKHGFVPAPRAVRAQGRSPRARAVVFAVCVFVIAGASDIHAPFALHGRGACAFLRRAAITRDSRHKRRATGGRRKIHVKKRKFECGRPPASTKLATEKRVHTVRCRGGNMKFRALRLDSGSFSWGSERACAPAPRAVRPRARRVDEGGCGLPPRAQA
jgi:hypothetical protein